MTPLWLFVGCGAVGLGGTPIYMIDHDHAVEIGPEGQQEIVETDHNPLSPAQQQLQSQFLKVIFAGHDHLPIQHITQVCNLMHGRTSKELQHCLHQFSMVTPGNLSAMLDLADNPVTPSPDKFGQACVETLPDHKLLEACKVVYADYYYSQGKLKSNESCPSMTLNQDSFATTKFAVALNQLSEYYSLPQNQHYGQDEQDLRRKYTIKPTEHGCGVVAQSTFERGDLVGLAGVGEVTWAHGLMMRFQDSPWLGSNLNHCGDDGANVVLRVQEGGDNQKNKLWVYASKEIAPGHELLVDYGRASQEFPLWVAAPPATWTCAAEMTASATSAEGEPQQMRRSGPE